jgi:hypothetical protein
MRRLVFPALLAASLAMASPARAADPDPGVAIAIGAATILVGFAVGGTLMAATGDNSGANEAGWLILESGFALAPLTSHAAVGEWGRGAVFASVPTATTLATIPVFLIDPAAVEHGSLPEQRVMWGLFVGGLATSMAGVIDTAFAPARRLRVAPVFGNGTAGVVIGGVL